MSLASHSRSVWLRVAITLVLAICVIAVERSNFKTCNQSEFCRRQKVELSQNLEVRYSIVAGSFALEEGKATASLLDKSDGSVLAVDLTAVADGIARLRILEKEPIRPRYEVHDVIMPYTPTDFKIVAQDESHVVLTTNDVQTVELIFAPFVVNFYTNGKLAVTTNSMNQLNFETLKKKPESMVEPEMGEDGSYTNKDEGKAFEQWQELMKNFEKENFKNFEDSKPYGNQAIGLDIAFTHSKHVYGIPEHADTLALKNTEGGDPYRLYNLDVFEFEIYNPMALYGSVPYMISHSMEATAGVLWLNAAETWVSIKDCHDENTQVPVKRTHWVSESGIVELYVMLGANPAEVSKHYTKLTGRTAMPPKWSLGYHQCRWNYNDMDDVYDVDANFDEHDIPYDTLWLDIEHTNDKRYMTWHKQNFKDPKAMQAEMADKNRHMVAIVDPHIKRDHGYKVHSGAANKYYVKKQNGKDYDGWCWPGSSSWLDFTRADVRDYWAGLFALDSYEGSTDILHIWNDMNEPSVFNGPEITMHKDAVFGANNEWEHRDIHNLYGLYTQQATFEGLQKRSDGKERPFVLSRAFYAGTQRYGAIWTGDNTASWDHLRVSPSMLLSINLAGIAFSGVDIGGFFGNPDNELFVRWYQAAVYYPFFRAHAHLDTNRREPWLLDEESRERIRVAAKQRYQLLDYWYTLFFQSHTAGEPVIRPIWYHYTHAEDTFDMDDGYFVGRDVYVNPVYEQGATTKNIYLPGPEKWYPLWNLGIASHGPANIVLPVNMDTVPAYQRGGSIIPMQLRPRRNVASMKDDPYTLRVTLNEEGYARGDLFIDDGSSTAHETGAFLLRTFVFSEGKLESRKIEPPLPHVQGDSSFSVNNRIERVILLGVKHSPSKVSVADGTSVRSLTFTYDPLTEALTVRDPAVAVASDFTLSVESL